MDEMDVFNVLDVMNVKDVTDIMDIPNEINGLNARGWVSFPFLVRRDLQSVRNACADLKSAVILHGDYKSP